MQNTTPVAHKICARCYDPCECGLCDFCSADLAARNAPWDGLPPRSEMCSETAQRMRDADAILSV